MNKSEIKKKLAEAVDKAMPGAIKDHARWKAGDAVREAMVHSWAPYVRHAWGADSLKPVSRTADDAFLGMGVGIVDAMDTLKIMGLDAEFAQVRGRNGWEGVCAHG